jgi:hypothetical protein
VALQLVKLSTPHAVVLWLNSRLQQIAGQKMTRRSVIVTHKSGPKPKEAILSYRDVWLKRSLVLANQEFPLFLVPSSAERLRKFQAGDVQVPLRWSQAQLSEIEIFIKTTKLGRLVRPSITLVSPYLCGIKCCQHVGAFPIGPELSCLFKRSKSWTKAAGSCAPLISN